MPKFYPYHAIINRKERQLHVSLRSISNRSFIAVSSLVLHMLAHGPDPVAVAVQQERQGCHDRGQDTHHGEDPVRSHVLIHRDRCRQQCSGNDIPAERHEGERRPGVDGIDEADVQVGRGEDGNQRVPKEERAENRRPDADAGLSYGQSWILQGD